MLTTLRRRVGWVGTRRGGLRWCRATRVRPRPRRGPTRRRGVRGRTATGRSASSPPRTWVDPARVHGPYPELARDRSNPRAERDLRPSPVTLRAHDQLTASAYRRTFGRSTRPCSSVCHVFSCHIHIAIASDESVERPRRFRSSSFDSTTITPPARMSHFGAVNSAVSSSSGGRARVDPCAGSSSSRRFQYAALRTFGKRQEPVLSPCL